MTSLKYFITGPHINLYESSASSNLVRHESFSARVVDENYREVLKLELSREEADIFRSIMESDKGALLYRTHEKLGDIAYFKIDKHEKVSIPDGAKYP